MEPVAADPRRVYGPHPCPQCGAMIIDTVWVHYRKDRYTGAVTYLHSKILPEPMTPMGQPHAAFCGKEH
jgi:hypothetical protein